MTTEEERLSTTALARKLEIPVQQLFATLRDYGWILRHGDNWLLTPKGEYEGGSYRDSKRFGRYIVWPETLAQHPLLAAIESNQRISASQMRRYYPRLQPRQLNRALAELGLQQHSILGWELTDFGRRFGGQQSESDSTGAFYVSWPHEIVDHPVIHRELERLSGPETAPVAAAAAQQGDPPDLFAAAPATVAEPRDCCGIDGHRTRSRLQATVCDWLYLAQQAHALYRALPVEEALQADFYLPAGSVYIDCWEETAPPAQLSARLRNKAVCKELGLRYLEIRAGDAGRLDEVLGRGLLAFGIRC
ncbi:hypothetical protein [Kineobactrum salinum]|uniref:Glycerol kinase n=1 Tax=Kineobactrum salinum TaxID=2708301 RepID=A0A6C0U5I9_9GAMM|nr:hypothetical protein [Kineobactrum salinum]QIB67381.1 hypothetical protein G3T16_20280 [Kineobactrum salinum]